MALCGTRQRSRPVARSKEMSVPSSRPTVAADVVTTTAVDALVGRSRFQPSTPAVAPKACTSEEATVTSHSPASVTRGEAPGTGADHRDRPVAGSKAWRMPPATPNAVSSEAVMVSQPVVGLVQTTSPVSSDRASSVPGASWLSRITRMCFAVAVRPRLWVASTG